MAKATGISMATFALMILAQSAGASPIPSHLLQEARPRKFNRSIPIERNLHVQMWIQYFSERDRERFDRFMTRGAVYKTLIQDILKKHRVPPELYYLAMIESGFARKARSHAQAVGIWQFIASTGKMYGLRIDPYVDERMDVIRSTEAAARHLRDLHAKFGSWYLSMAAYNAGESRIRKAVQRGKTKDFWILARRKLIPAETAHYIPKFQAAMQIGRNPERYGFSRKTLYEYPKVTPARIHGQLHLKELARKKKVSVSTLKALNPHLIREKTPKARRGYDVWLPRKTPRLAL